MSVVKEQIAKKKNGTGPRKHYYHTNEGTADWSKQDGQKILELIAVIAENGGAVRLGYTRDGGAYSVGVYGDGPTPYTDYLRPGEDVETYFRDLADDFRDAGVGNSSRGNA